jgi:hypothetical protein
MAGSLKIKSDQVWGNYRGRVEDNNDPLQLCRCRIRIYPLFKDMEATTLPWAVPAFDLFDGAGSGTGNNKIPKVGTMVYCFFEAGDIYQPVYFAEAQDAVNGLPEERLTDYPNTKVWKTQSGITIIIDDATQNIIINHPSGTNIQVLGTDDVQINHSTGAFFEILAIGKIVLSTAGKIELDSSVVTVNGNMDISTGWTGTFTTADGKTVTVSTGIITEVS